MGLAVLQPVIVAQGPFGAITQSSGVSLRDLAGVTPNAGSIRTGERLAFLVRAN